METMTVGGLDVEDGGDRDDEEDDVRGTSTSEEGKWYFSNVDQNKRSFLWDEGSEAASENAFGTSEDKRKKWIEKYVPGTYLDQKKQQITYSDFVNKELILYSTVQIL
ncbi:hypothetical protein ARALYDRAFT_897896 [Arabidopsis lyrata subsp. lyrata]|uniref:DNA topoisomerase (ATP-hydrolyzing) n=1 Tax=Arabidopsis lyrata subsp. lyrata TaxID=81972 RepID=D7L4Z4_ARALL|nr:hypothetical protein ARALYDRAFT_897896 [Arabidopsis lyrata subsp. lyrata]